MADVYRHQVVQHSMWLVTTEFHETQAVFRTRAHVYRQQVVQHYVAGND